MSKQEYIKERYELLSKLYGLKSSLWSQIHECYSPSMFCEDNRKSLIAEYLEWEDFVEDAKDVNFIYYYGIDVFLTAYKKAVYSCLKNC